jgi:hypothetical protein
MAQAVFPSQTQAIYTTKYRPPVAESGPSWGTWLLLGGAGALIYLDVTGKLQPLIARLMGGSPVLPPPSGSTTGSGVPPSGSGTPPSGGTAGYHVPTSVTLTGPGTGQVGQPITVQAQATGVSRAVYQFWVYPPGGAPPGPDVQNGWISSGTFSLSPQYQFTPSQAGVYQVVAYARSVNAPPGVQSAKTQSNILNIAVAGAPGDPLTVGGSAFAAVPATLPTNGRTVVAYAGPWPGVPGGVGLAVYGPRGTLQGIRLGIYHPGLQDQIGSVAAGQYQPPGAYVLVTG